MNNRVMNTFATLGLGFSLLTGVWAETPTAKKNPSDKAASSVTMADKRWVNKVHNGGMLEVALGELAASRGASAEVKAFGKKMVADHSAANAELKMLADKKGIQLDKPDPKVDSNYKKLSALSGGNFDSQYVEMMVKDHKDDVSAFQSEFEKGGDPNLKAWAGKTLPTLRLHLKSVLELQIAMGNKHM